MDVESAAKLFELIKRRTGTASLEQADAGSTTNKHEDLLRKVFLKYTYGNDTRLGGTFFRVNDTSPPSRDGLKVSDLRISASPFDTLPGLSLGRIHQAGDRRSQCACLVFADRLQLQRSLPAPPRITYRYYEFSVAYDSLLYGYGGDWGTWVQGEIVGENMLFNMNRKTSMVNLLR